MASLAAKLQSDYYFSSNVSFFQISDSGGNLTQAIAPVDNRRYLSVRYELAQNGQVLFVRSGNKRNQFLADELGKGQGWSIEPQAKIADCAAPNRTTACVLFLRWAFRPA